MLGGTVQRVVSFFVTMHLWSPYILIHMYKGIYCEQACGNQRLILVVISIVCIDGGISQSNPEFGALLSRAIS